MVWVLVGCKRLCPAVTGHGLVTLFSLSTSVKDRPLHWTLGKSQTYYPKHILGMGVGKTCYSLIMSSGSFRIDCQGGFWVGGPCTALSSGLRGGGLESQFGWGPRPHDRRVVGWSRLCLGCKQGVCFEVPSWAH
jgi:hypothetical protein